jgi:zinc protease
LENDDQQGLAHFVEHMCFNGTKKFPKQDIINFLEKTGVRFGPHLNAYTSFDETVYMIQIPTDSIEVIHKAFEILEEWAHNVAFDSTEIDKERGVVVEEWRLGRGAFERISNKHNPVVFYNSQYAKRLPIGKKEILEHCSYETLKQFYRDWYRPDLMAVAAVGDFDKTAIEKLIKEHFAPLKNPPAERERTQYKLPDHQQTLVSVATDAELPYTTVNVYFKRTKDEEKTAGDYRRTIVGGLYDGMLNARLQELLQKPNPPFVFGQTGNFRFVGDKQGYMLFAAVRENSILPGMDALLTEAFKVKQHGFTESELERQKKESLRFIEQAYKERDKTESRSYAEEYIRNFLQEEPIPGIAVENDIYKQFVPGITLVEINQLSSVRITDGNRIVTVSAPKKEGVVVPADSAILVEINAASTRQTQAYVDVVSNKPLIENLPKPGSVTNTVVMKSIGVTEWTLSNGARVYLKPTDFKNDEILFSAYSKGGTSLAEDKDFVSAENAATIVDQGGIGGFDAIALQKMMAGKVVNVSPGISELSENFNGNASPQDLETLFQLVHLYFTAPRKDTGAANAYLSRIKGFLANRKVSPEAAFQDTSMVTMAQYHYRARPISPELFGEINLDRAFAFYKDRFADASDFSFVFVGNFEPEKIKPLVEQYLATLPSLKRTESWRDIGMRYPTGVISKEVRRGIEPKSAVQMNFTGPFTWARQNRYDFNAMLEVLRIKLREVLREDKGGVYGVSVNGTPSLFPRQEYRITISFGCAPDRVDELVGTTLQQIDSLKIKPADPIYITKVKELQRRDREVNLKENRWWLSTLRVDIANNEDPQEINDYGTLVDHFAAEAVQKAAQQYFNMKNYVKIVLNPEKK